MLIYRIVLRSFCLYWANVMCNCVTLPSPSQLQSSLHALFNNLSSWDTKTQAPGKATIAAPRPAIDLTIHENQA